MAFKQFSIKISTFKHQKLLLKNLRTFKVNMNPGPMTEGQYDMNRICLCHKWLKD